MSSMVFWAAGTFTFPKNMARFTSAQSKAGKKNINEYALPLEHNGEQVKETEYMTDALSREAVRHRDGFSDVGGRLDQWKICRDANGPWKLFNIEEDISEKRDLSNQLPDRLKEMVSNTQTWAQNHTKPRWFHELKARDSWNEAGMPKYEQTFALTPGVSPTANTESPKKAKSKGDSTRAEFIAIEKLKWEKNGWKWNPTKAEELFEKIDANQDGIASGKEKKAYWANFQKEKPADR